MNKFLSLMACALVGFSASAAVTSLYVAGPSTTTVNGVTLGNWDIVNTVEVTVNRGLIARTWILLPFPTRNSRWKAGATG